MERLNGNDEFEREQIRALSPEEILELKHELTPPEVLETVNRLLAEKFKRGGYVHLKQEEVIAALEERGLERADIFARHWLDFEDIYRDAGWEVVYDAPGFNESYDAYFEFRAPRESQRSLGSTATSRAVRRP